MNKRKMKIVFLCLALVCSVFIAHRVDTSASAGSVTGYQKITWGISTGRYYVNGIHAFCAQYSKSWPTVGTVVEQIVPCTNDVLRKALYYGYNGPQNTLGTDERAHVLTAIAVSDANIGEAETGASAKYDAFYWELVNNAANYPSPPSSFKAYLAITASDAMQNLAFYEIEENGTVHAIKSSSNPQLHQGNPCYSLAGAQYGIYTQASLEEGARIGTLTTDANGNTNTLELPPGNYYACENLAPPGYARSTQVTSFTISEKQTTTLQFTDIPQSNPIDILIRKVDADTNQAVPTGKASLAGAWFRVCYYAGLWPAEVDPADLGVLPTRTWVFQTDDKGVVRYSQDYYVSGDELYGNLPLGTVVIRETKASEGYLLNDAVFVRQITAEGSSEYVSTYQYPIVTEKAVEVRVVKYQADTEITLPGTVFEYTAPDGSKEELVTDENGELVLKGLQYGTHALREQFVMEGYVLEDSEHTFVLDEETNQHMEIAIYNQLAPYDLVVHKTDLQKKLLSGAIFALYEDAECLQELQRGVTDENGCFRFSNLEVGKTYYFKEVEPPAGYTIQFDENGATHVYELRVESMPTKEEFVCYLDGDVYQNIVKGEALWEVCIDVQNDPVYVPPSIEARKMVSPQTGDHNETKIYLGIGAISLILIVIMSCHNRFKCDKMTGKH